MPPSQRFNIWKQQEILADMYDTPNCRGQRLICHVGTNSVVCVTKTGVVVKSRCGQVELRKISNLITVIKSNLQKFKWNHKRPQITI